MANHSNIVSLSAARITRKSMRMAYSAGSLVLDFSDVVREGSQMADGSWVNSLKDPIALGIVAQMQVRSIFWRHGLRQMPETWGELLGNWNYCRLLSMWKISVAPGQGPAMQQAMRDWHDKRYPGRGALLLSLVAGDVDAAAAWHCADKTFTRNAEDVRLTANLPPAGVSDDEI